MSARPERTISSDQGASERELSRLPAAIAFSFSPPAIPGVGTSEDSLLSLRMRRKRCAVPGQDLTTFLEAARKRPEDCRLEHNLPAQRPTTVCRGGPGQSAKAGCAPSTMSTGRSKHSWAGTHQLFQSLRPSMAGLYRSGKTNTAPRRKTSGSSTFAIAKVRTSRCPP